MGKLVCIRPQLPLDMAGREPGATEGGLEDHGESSGMKLPLWVLIIVGLGLRHVCRLEYRSEQHLERGLG